MHPISSDRAILRHDQAHPELRPGQLVTWQEAEASRRRIRRPPRQLALFRRDRQRSMNRRRQLAASGPMPPAMAASFTTGHQAVLRILGDECRQHGRCVEFMDAIAARAGVGRRTAQAALREAERLGLVVIVERRITGTRNDSNVVTIISAEWLAWLRIGPKKQGANNFRARTISDSRSELCREERPQKESAGVEFARFVPHSPP